MGNTDIWLHGFLRGISARLTFYPGIEWMSVWSPDEGKFNLWVLPLTGDDHKPRPYLQTESSESQAQFPPDSRWIAYGSDESGKNEVYVRPFPAASSGKWMVSKGGGKQSRWRRDGKELF